MATSTATVVYTEVVWGIGNYQTPYGTITSTETAFEPAYTARGVAYAQVYEYLYITANASSTCRNFVKYGSLLQPNPDVSGLGVRVLPLVRDAHPQRELML